jgi:protease-4
VELTIDSDGKLEEKPSSFVERFFTLPESALSVLALLKRLENDPMIAGLLLNINGFNFGDARTQEWRDAIIALRKANKEVIVYLDAPSERDYYIASAANKIHMNEAATLSFHRFRATLVYFADLLSNLGVKADAVVAGSYKTAPRAFTNSRPQKEEVEIANKILDDFYNALLTDVSDARKIDRGTLKELFDRGEVTADDAKTAGLVDELVAAEHNVKPYSEEMEVSFFRGYTDRSFKQDKWQGPKKIAVIPIVDDIAEGRALPGMLSFFFPRTGSKDVIDEIAEAVEDPDVVGLIVRIDSPGGDANAADRINKALMAAQKQKPVVTSMSDVAASAGYLIAAGTGHIMAMPNTITGSIGVFSLMFSAEDLANKVGVFSKELSPIKNPGPTTLRRISETERAQAQRITNWFYQNFIQTVAVGLKLDPKEVATLAEGKVWLGREALEKKLIHELGGFSKAIDKVRALADLPEDEELAIEIRTPGYTETFTLTSGILSWFNQRSEASIKPVADLASPYIRALTAYNLHGVPQARMPFHIERPKR